MGRTTSVVLATLLVLFLWLLGPLVSHERPPPTTSVATTAVTAAAAPPAYEPNDPWTRVIAEQQRSQSVPLDDDAFLADPTGAMHEPPREESPPPPPPSPASSAWTWSLTDVGPFDLDARDGLRAAVAARAPRREVALFTSNAKGIPPAVNMAIQLRRFGVEHHLVLAERRQTCDDAQRVWGWLGCGWSHGIGTLDAWTRRYGGGEQTALWTLWSAKWLVIARLAEVRCAAALGWSSISLPRRLASQQQISPLLRLLPPAASSHSASAYTLLCRYSPRGHAAAPTRPPSSSASTCSASTRT